MRDGITFSLSEADRQRLSDIAAAPLSPQKHVWRTRIVLLSSDGLGTSAIMTATGKSKTCVWRWQERFMHEGVDGLLRDKSRPPGRAPVAPKRVAEIVRLTQETPKSASACSSGVLRVRERRALKPRRNGSVSFRANKRHDEPLRPKAVRKTSFWQRSGTNCAILWAPSAMRCSC